MLTEAARRKVSERESLRENVKASSSIRAALAAANIDPAGISCLRAIADAEARLVGLGDTPELQRGASLFDWYAWSLAVPPH